MSAHLPPIIALKSSFFNAYLSYNNDSDSEQNGFFIFNEGTSVFSSIAKFEVVTANTGTGLVHLRSLHNRKFIRRRQAAGGFRHFSPEADEPVEDPSNAFSSTLFEPRVAVDGKPDRVWLIHIGGVSGGVYANPYMSTMFPGKRYLGLINTASPTAQNIFDIIDLESLIILPRHVALKGDNDLYLQHTNNNELRFISDDKGHADSWFEVSTDRDGIAEFKVFNSSNNRYLRFNSADNRIIAHGSPSGFRPVKIDASTVALICLSNDKFCTRHTSPTTESGLSALNTNFSINKWSLLTLEELVVSRTIYNADFNLQNAVIYGETPVTMATVNASNNTSEPNKVNFNFTYTDFQSSTWGANHSWMVGGKFRVRFGIPFIKSATVTVEGEYSGSYEWEETITTENKLETTYTVTVPAHTSISVSLLATKGQCDVPYSYYQRDLLYNGRSVIYRKEDGLYTGINSYNFRYEVATLKEPDSKADLPYKAQMLPHPSSIGPSKQQKIPLPTEKTLVTTTTPEQEFSLLQVDDVASSTMKEPDSKAVSPTPEPALQVDDVA